MGEHDPKVLKGELEKTREALDEIFAFFNRSLEKDIPLLGKSQSAAFLIAGIIENYYTCLETGFLRISQFFENDLRKDRWHKDLLLKMTISIDGVRIAVIADKTHTILQELLDFRHFRRYYYRVEFDWDRIEHLINKIKQVHPLIKNDISRFLNFLDSLR